MKNAPLLTMSILLQFGGVILAPLCSDDSIQTLLILPQFQMFGCHHFGTLLLIWMGYWY